MFTGRDRFQDECSRFQLDLGCEAKALSLPMTTALAFQDRFDGQLPHPTQQFTHALLGRLGVPPVGIVSWIGVSWCRAHPLNCCTARFFSIGYCLFTSDPFFLAENFPEPTTASSESLTFYENPISSPGDNFGKYFFSFGWSDLPAFRYTSPLAALLYSWA